MPTPTNSIYSIMHEVISLSSSQRSGHVLTHLYNEQESHVPYRKDAVLTHSNDVFLWPVKTLGKVNYYPRSISFEFSGGYGFLGRFEYHEPKTDLGLDALQLQDRVPKNEFQHALDAGKQTDSGLLSTANTKYWTDYNKLIYRPDSLVELPNYTHPDGTHRHFQKATFSNFHTGEEEFKLIFDVCDDAFRKNLEGLDNIQGINFFSEVDNAWGGFTSEMLVQLKDEYFNNGANSKHNLWCYGFLGKENRLTRIKSLVELAKNSTLFFPLCTPNSSFFENFDSSSLWHQGAAHSMFVDSIWGLNCQMESPVRMADIENGVLQGNSNRNIVNEVFLTESKPVVSDLSSLSFGIVSDVNISDMYLTGGHTQQKTQNVDSNANIGFSVSSDGKRIGAKHIVSKSSLETENAQVYVNPSMDHITTLDTFPPIMEKKPYQVEFGQTSSFRETLKEYRKYIQRVRLPTHLEVIGDKAELIEDLSNLVEEYTVGYEDESDWE